MKRRTFLKTATQLSALTVAAPMIFAQEAKGANGRIGVGFIGTGGRCGEHLGIINNFQKAGIAQPVAVCDVYRPRLIAASKATGNSKMYDKHEELLQDTNVDVVCIASPDHHHAYQAIDAINAGKDVYCEKPLVHWTQFEVAKEIEKAAKAKGKLVQVGTQHMADDNYPKIRKLIEEGVIGKPVQVECGYFRRGDWGEVMPIPDRNAKEGADLDWKRFLQHSPNEDRPFDVSRFFQWRLYWDYAGGPSTDLLVHTYTPVFALLGLDYPVRVFGGGGLFQYPSPPREVPDQCNIIADYKGGPSVVMTNSLSNYYGKDTVIRGTDGVILWGTIQGRSDASKYNGVRIVPWVNGKADASKPEIVIPWAGNGDTGKLWKNLLECVKTRQEVMCPISIGVKVQAPLSMGILSHRENKVAMFDFEKQAITMN
ncbi:MAG: Gfo/Idh/MocA family oxidoreductase [Planctomycetaceae bacterium]|jgi:predicted dehydrogenase|nr:Gfo/Idh/MocA family oxidoreductase [Planctomycetaceae bacterium]